VLLAPGKLPSRTLNADRARKPEHVDARVLAYSFEDMICGPKQCT
jgi:hypothetical protein